MFKNLSFSKKIMFILGFTSILIILGIGITTYLKFKNDLEQKVKDELEKANKSTYDLIENSINTAVRIHLRSIAEKVRDLVRYNYDLYKKGKISRPEADRRIKELVLDPEFGKIGKTGYLEISDINGNLLMHPYRIGENVVDERYMQSGIRNKNDYTEYMWQNPGEKNPRMKAAYFTYFEPWDYLIWATSYKDDFIDLINLRALRKTILSIRLGKKGYVYILNMRGNLIIHPDPQLEGKNTFEFKDSAEPGRYFVQEIIDGAKNKGTGTITYAWKNPSENRARGKIVVYKRLETLDWIICSSFYYEDLYAPLEDLKNIIILISAIALILIILLSIFIGKSISKPIKRLAEGAESIGKGNLDIRIPVESSDEIGYLSKEFNEMAANLKSSKIEIEKAMKKVEKANQTKNIFLANMSHEIRTPLTSILGHTEILLPLVTDLKIKSSLENIKASSITLKDFIDNTLYMSKVEAEKLIIRIEPINLYSALNEIRGNFTFAMNAKRLEYMEDIEPWIPQYVDLDKLRLKQILINLIGNAVNYTDKGFVKLHVTMKPNTIDKSKIDLIFSVEDTGIGISQEDQQKLFVPFERLEDRDKKKRDGSGLGLALSKRIIELMGGEISVNSDKGKGSTFKFVLRNVNVPSGQTGTADGEDFDYSTIDFERQKLLVVDDVEDMRKIIKAYLEGTNIQVLEAESGEDAMYILKDNKPDLVLTDIKMPHGMSGVELTEKIKEDESLKGIPVFAFTASKTDPEDVERYKDLFDRYLFKPVSKAKLFFELSKFLKTKTQSIKDEKPEQIIDLGKIKLTPEDKKFLPEIIAKLNEYLKLWESTSKNNNFDEIKNFGLKIKELGDEYSVEGLSGYGNEVVFNVDNFKIRNIKSLLKQYPNLIDKFKFYEKEDL